MSNDAINIVDVVTIHRTQYDALVNPLKVIAKNWYGNLTDSRAKKLDRLWRKFIATLPPAQGDLFGELAKQVEPSH